MIIKALGGGMITGLAAVGGCNRDGHDTSLDGTAGKAGKNPASIPGGAGSVSLADRPNTIPGSCHKNPVGTCCDVRECFPIESVVENFRRAGELVMSMGKDDDAGTQSACPARRTYLGPCNYPSPLISEDDSQCCYAHKVGDCCGRPFVIAERARTATIRARRDWLGDHVAELVVMDSLTRAELASAWLSDARMEHASIASFARFTLQALALGAPAELIADAQRAALDEVAHAQHCFALASRYGAEPLGPGELPMAGALVVSALADVAAATVREGCVGETLAACQARAQLTVATDMFVREALARIAEDEARHAELAWRFVRWAVAEGGEPVANAVACAFAASLRELHAEPLRALPQVVATVWREHGRLTPAAERACHLEAATEVIEPCARALLSIAGSALQHSGRG